MGLRQGLLHGFVASRRFPISPLVVGYSAHADPILASEIVPASRQANHRCRVRPTGFMDPRSPFRVGSEAGEGEPDQRVLPAGSTGITAERRSRQDRNAGSSVMVIKQVESAPRIATNPTVFKPG